MIDKNYSPMINWW